MNASRTDYDLVVIGAGIHGAGVVQAAAAAGYRVLALEKSAIAAGTSSKSSKLIHGGLRYLENGQFSLVRECLNERRLLLRIAPELVQLKPFLIPIYDHSHRSPLTIRAGLTLYSLLGGLDAQSRFSAIPRSQWQQLNGLSTDGLRKVFRYYDAQTDDQQLTRAVIQSARELGAELLLPAALTAAEVDAAGCSVHFRHDRREHTVTAQALINCAGPWATTVQTRIKPAATPPAVDYVQGTHIVFSPKDLSHWDGIYYLEAPRDRRAVFAIPWKGQLMVGTTELKYTGAIDQVTATDDEIDYLLETFRHYFPDQFPTQPSHREQSAIGRFCGLRVLPSTGDSPFHRSRETLLWQAAPRCLTVLGGKLTTYRLTAEKVLHQLRPCLPPPRPIANTASLPLTPAID